LKIFKLLSFLTITCWFGCSDNQVEEISSQCPYIDSTSETDFRVAYLNRMHSNPPYQTHFGVGMDHGLMDGQDSYADINGKKYSYITFTTVITNDSTLPVQLKLNFSKEYAYPSPYNEQKFKLFLAPIKESLQQQIDFNHLSEGSKKLLTPGSSSITLGNGFIEETKQFIDTYVPFTLDQTIDPNEKYLIKIGVLLDAEIVNPGQLALISKGHMYPFFSHYCEIDQIVSVNKPMSLFLGLDFFRTDRAVYKSFTVIPCGEISFLK
jgi:hypothetical protein